MATKSSIIEALKSEIQHLGTHAAAEKTGTILEVSDGIARMSGLTDALTAEMLEFPGGTMGVVLNLEEQSVGAMLLGDYSHIKAGDQVKSTGRVLSIPVSDKIVGRVVNPLGEAVDGKGEISGKATMMPVDKVAPGVITRQSVSQPLMTGIKAIDSMIPIGKGQRELIIGDRQTGKTTIAIDTIINQKGKDVKCVYVAIGQKESKIAQILGRLEAAGAMDHTIIVMAGASDAASLTYLAPYAGTAIAEYFMAKGEDVLVVYDDLSKHAWAYREVSLLLRRPPGREAYPGDVFYLHSRLLERSARLNKESGGGSITSLPIIETQSGDVSAYIPTNVISITDGQIFLEGDLFNKGVRPAVNVGISVSRVGSSAQTKAMKRVAGKLRLEMAQFRELEAFAQFASDLDETTRKQIERGRRAAELLKQGQYAPLSLASQTTILYALIAGKLDDVAVEKIGAFEVGFRDYLGKTRRDIVEAIDKELDLSDETKAKIEEAVAEYKKING